MTPSIPAIPVTPTRRSTIRESGGRCCFYIPFFYSCLPGNVSSVVNESISKLWTTTTTTTIKESISTTTTPLSSPTKSSLRKSTTSLKAPTTPTRVRTTSAQPAVHHYGPYVPPIPHPDRIKGPERGLIPEGYYVVSVGQEVGIFYYWCVKLFGWFANSLLRIFG